MPTPDDRTTLDSDNIHSDPDRVPENRLSVEVQQLDLKQPESADQEAQGGALDPQLECGKSDGGEAEEEKHDDGEDGEEEEEEEKRNENGSNESDKEGDDKEERLDDRRKNKFPVRPEAEDCAFYLKTGTCKFGSNCKFNHPPRRKLHVASILSVCSRVFMRH